MARTLLSGIAIAAGTGLALSFCAFRRRTHSRTRQPASLEPLIERLNRIEARVTQAEWPPAPELSADVAAVRASLVIIDERLAAQSHEIEMLRIRAAGNEKLVEAEVRLTERRFKEAAAALPTEIEAVVLPRVEELRERLSTEMKESVAGALQKFEQSLDARVSSRITALEDKLLEHSASLADLSHRTTEANTNLQKLVNAVERLCEQSAPEPAPPAAPEVPAQQPTFFEMPFEHQPREASAESSPAVTNAVATVPETPPWRIVPEDEPSRRPRVTFAHVMIAAAAAFIGLRFVR